MRAILHRFLRLLTLTGCLLALARVEAAVPVQPTDITSGLRLAGNLIDVSADGRWMVFGTTRGLAYFDSENTQMVDIDGALRAIGPVPQMGWSPAGDTVAVNYHREGKIALVLWKVGEGQERAALREMIVYPRALTAKTPVVWSPDGRTIYLVINQDLPWPKMPPDQDNPPSMGVNARISVSGAYNVGAESRRGIILEYPEAYAESTRSLIMAVDVATQKVGLLAKGNDIDSIFLSPDGRHLAAMQIKSGYRPAVDPENARPGSAGKQLFGDVYLIDLAGAEVSALPTIELEGMEDRQAGWSDRRGQRLDPVLKNIHTITTNMIEYGGSDGNPTLVWSPDSRHFAFATVGGLSTGDVYTYEVATRSLRNLTEKIVPRFTEKSLGYGENLTHLNDSRKFGGAYNPLWHPDSQALFTIAKGDAWFIPLGESSTPRNLTAKFKEESMRLVPTKLLTTIALDGAGRALLVAKNRDSRLDSIWKLDPVTGDTSPIAETGVWTNSYLATDARTDNLFFTGQTTNSVGNIYRVGLNSTGAALPEAITKFKPLLASRIFPETRVLSWQTPDGYKAYGLLYLPSRASPERPVPLIFDAHPGYDVSVVNLRGKMGAAIYEDWIHGMLRDGVAVLLADVPMSDTGVYERPMKQMIDGTNAAIDAALATGLIDARRMGLMGTEQGGNLVNAVLTQTTRFKAAVSISGTTSPIAEYMTSAASDGFYHEFGAGRFEKPLWDEPQRYVENSPIMAWGKVSTPLLVVNGLGPVAGHLVQEGFNGLRRLGRDAVLAVYPRAGVKNNAEVNVRIRGWFREHLLDDKPITQFAEQGSFMFGGGQDGDRATVPAKPSTPRP